VLVVLVCGWMRYSKARSGRVTRILLNLCASLIILLIVLYIAETFADSRLGCRVANVFRYYLVLVSLFWNGVEAHNMYRMLIKVFDPGQQSHFVLKAAVVAWGLSCSFSFVKSENIDFLGFILLFKLATQFIV